MSVGMHTEDYTFWAIAYITVRMDRCFNPLGYTWPQHLYIVVVWCPGGTVDCVAVGALPRRPFFMQSIKHHFHPRLLC
jgi:hypothetical protein